MNVYVDATLEIPDDPRYYTEGRNEVSNIQIPAIRQFIEVYKKHHLLEKHFEMIGNIHTHPGLPHEFRDGVKPWHPSDPDIECVVQWYVDGQIPYDKPFIFGVAGPTHTPGETGYTFYRVVKTGKDSYEHRKIEWK